MADSNVSQMKSPVEDALTEVLSEALEKAFEAEEPYTKTPTFALDIKPL